MFGLNLGLTVYKKLSEYRNFSLSSRPTIIGLTAEKCIILADTSAVSMFNCSLAMEMKT
jgi:hypothetical protein